MIKGAVYIKHLGNASARNEIKGHHFCCISLISNKFQSELHHPPNTDLREPSDSMSVNKLCISESLAKDFLSSTMMF